MQRSPFPIIETDANLVITHWNQAAEQVFGYTHPEAVGRSLLDSG
jgi:PAS domain S-box-containing protein